MMGFKVMQGYSLMFSHINHSPTVQICLCYNLIWNWLLTTVGHRKVSIKQCVTSNFYQTVNHTCLLVPFYPWGLPFSTYTQGSWPPAIPWFACTAYGCTCTTWMVFLQMTIWMLHAFAVISVVAPKCGFVAFCSVVNSIWRQHNISSRVSDSTYWQYHHVRVSTRLNRRTNCCTSPD